MCIKSDNHSDVGSWDMECDEQKFMSFSTFCAFLPSNNTWKIKILNKKNAWIYMFILHRRTINENHMMYGSWDMECDRQNVIWGHFLALLPQLATCKINILKKFLKKAPGDIIILHLGNTIDNYMIWFLRYGVQWTELFALLDQFLPFYLSKHLMPYSRPLLGVTIPPNLVFWLLRKIFSLEINKKWHLFMGCKQTKCPFSEDVPPKNASMPPMSRIDPAPGKWKFWKHERNTWRYYHFTQAYHKWQSCDVCFLRLERDTFFCPFEPFFALLPTVRVVYIAYVYTPTYIMILEMLPLTHILIFSLWSIFIFS